MQSFLCSLPSEQFVSYIMARTSYIQWDGDEVFFVLEQQAYFFIMLAHWNNSLLVDILLHSDIITLIPMQPIFALIPLCCILSGEESKYKFIVPG